MVVLLVLLGCLPVSAQPLHHAALIVDFGDGRVVVRVVSFAEETISGVDLLQRSGLDVAIMSNLGGGAALCAVEGVGCPPTPQDCFCQCRGADCRYWSYFHLQGGAWVYAGMGAAGRFLGDGDVDGWVWGDGRSAPPLLTWEEIWARGGARPTATLPPPPAGATPAAPTAPPPPPTAVPDTPTPALSPVVSAAPPLSLSPSPSTAPAGGLPTPSPPIAGETAAPPAAPSSGPSPTSPPAAAGAGGFSPGPALAFGGFVLALLALGLWVRRRKRVG